MENSQEVRVVTSCRGRFHIFDQARELARHNFLYRLITDYPKAWPARFGVPPDRVRTLLLTGFINHGLAKLNSHLPAGRQVNVDRWVHDRFSLELAGVVPRDANFFIGLSSFCLEALERCRDLGISSAVDHGSFHQQDNRQLVLDEAKRWDAPMSDSIAADWVIEKEEKEFKCADHVFALSMAARDSLVRCGVMREKIFVNPCGVDLSQFHSAKKTDGVFRIIQVGGIVLGKGVLTLLDAFAQAKLRQAELWFVGGGLDTSGLKSIASAMRSPGVAFHQPVPQAELRNYYNQSSVCVLASVADGFGMVVAQAMACGLPVIVTENVGAKDLVQDGVNGFVVPVGSPEIIAERLRRLHADPGLCRAMGAAARQTVADGYSWKAYGDRLASFLRTKVAT
jgi:glycosyltransferase involved in cell wall biosynthesis